MLKRLFVSLALLLSGFAYAELPSGLVSISTSASTAVAPDEYVASVSVQHIDRVAAVAADEVNRAMQNAQTLAGQRQIELYSGGYNTYFDRKNNRFVMSASATLVADDSALLAELIAELQSSMNYNGTSGRLKPDTRAASENDLIAEAIAKFHDRARLVANSLGGHSYRIYDLDVQTQGEPPYRPMAMMRSTVQAESVAAPSIELDDEQVSVSVRGRIVVEGL